MMRQRAFLPSIRGAWCWSLLLLLLLAACGGGSAPSPTATPAATASTVPAASQDKISDVFRQLLAIYQSQGLTAATDYATDQGLLTKQGEVRVTLVLDSADPAVVQGTALVLARFGARVTSTVEDRVELVMPAQALLDYGKQTNRTSFFHDLADLAHVQSIRRTPIAQTGAGTPTVAPTARGTVSGGKSEGVILTGADKWQAAGITGKGVRVGVLDGSFANYQQFVPGTISAKSFRSDGLIGDAEANSESIHGTACAEIVREMAPDAELYLAAVQTAGEYVNAINWLVKTAKVSVITTSYGFYAGVPTDGTSIAARAVDRARAAGVFFAVLAGNSASGNIGSANFMGHFATTFVDKDGDGFHDFPGAKQANSFLMRVNRTRTVILSLQWDDWKQTHVNYDLFLYDSTGKEVAHSTNDQAKMPAADPVEDFRVTLKEGVYTIRVKKVNHGDPDLPFALNFLGAQLEQVTPTDSLWSPGDARGAITVAAIDVKTDMVEPYSSQGPTADGRSKPDLGGLDNVASYAYASVGDATFTGTSAATPHVAGAAALYKQAFPDATPDAILVYLTKHVKPPKGENVGENITGAGRLFLDAVPQGASTTPAATKAPTTTRVPGTVVATASSTRPPATATRAATGTPSATATPAATTVVFTDDYSSTASGLPKAGYQKGEYHISTEANYTRFGTYPKTIGDVDFDIYEVTARRVSGASDLYMGIVLRYIDKDNFVVFTVSNTGAYVFLIMENGSLHAVGDPGTTTAIKSNGPNTIQVGGIGTTFLALVNNQVVASVDIPDAAPGGAFGLFVGGTQTGGEAAFDNYTVTVA